MTIYTDSATLSTATSPSATEIAAFAGSGTISTTTQISAADVGPITDSSTVGSLTEITVGEFEFVHPTGSWGPFDTDNGVI